MNELKTLTKTGNTYLKFYMYFHVFWQIVSILILMAVVMGIGVLFFQSMGIVNGFGV